MHHTQDKISSNCYHYIKFQNLSIPNSRKRNKKTKKKAQNYLKNKVKKMSEVNLSRNWIEQRRQQ